ncbi:thioesterase domain protein [Periconia macrospinosa]|uniref:Thioesterase domain protein n=1 Tax=Periconia macrospinosa TaxID=97972 RepID=A0A2V1DH67_9PLEO|nr:thioesterase domain protein [Periconia macrospinosa]
MASFHIKHLLEASAQDPNSPYPGLTFYDTGDQALETNLSYADLLATARRYAALVLKGPGFVPGKIVVLYFNNHFDNITWFWASVLANGIPTPCPGFSNSHEQRIRQTEHLQSLLDEPVILTQEQLLDHFPTRDGFKLQLRTIESLKELKIEKLHHSYEDHHRHDDLAVLMLTSGSTGKSKAVCITHEQILASVRGKASVRPLSPPGTAFLNWIGLDHVANLTEIHLHAMSLGAQQVHVSASALVVKPELFLHLLSKHKVGRTFAPNFFFVRLRDMLLQLEDQKSKLGGVDLRHLTWLGTGGEATTVETCALLTRLLKPLGLPENAIAPGFGMTETCAGAIYNTSCPAHDLEQGYEFANLGQCMPGISLRISNSSKEAMDPDTVNQHGELEVKGDVVFKKYYNNAEATTDAFTGDGWFRTGDQACLDAEGNLVLVGRKKDTININGVKHSPHELELAIEDAQIEGIKPSYVVCFSCLRVETKEETICIAYAPSYASDDFNSRATTRSAISRVIVLETGAAPDILPLDTTVMQKSALGKLSRGQIKTALDQGKLNAFHDADQIALKKYKAWNFIPPANNTEQILRHQFCDILDMNVHEFSVNASLYDMGITSVQLIRLKHQIEEALSLPTPISIHTLMVNPTIRSLATSLNPSRTNSAHDSPVENQSYDPVVTLQSAGHKSPLFLIHPGVGEILVFFNLAKYFSDRPVHALRAREFEANEACFASIEEAVACYYDAIKRVQPTGPYAIAGYSYGAMLAFETAKVLTMRGDHVGFVGSFNLPPHIKFRMRQLDWGECLLHLAYFLNLISESHSSQLSSAVSTLPRPKALDLVLSQASEDRAKELSLTRPSFAKWVDVAFGLQSMARDYEPRGSVPSIDVFAAVPLAAHLNRWGEFSKAETRIHNVEGAHYTMLSPDHVGSFQKVLKKALKSRGL